MNKSTLQIIKATLSADSTIPSEQKQEALNALQGQGTKKQFSPLVLTQRQAADLLGVSRYTIRKMRKEKILQPVRVHDQYKYRLSDIEKLIQSSTS